ncbi:MAG: TetR/AcrR family transcriptional regulator [Terracidiphilus sp.]|jgi:TetR/AcrR family transcriptional regulator
MNTLNSSRSQTERADLTRARILESAVRQFSANGLAGARTEQIAEEAGVNKALLYYYFKSKEDLYAAALESVFEEVRSNSIAVLETDASAGERFLQIVLGNFDRSYSHPSWRALMQHEMVRLHRGEQNSLAPMAERFFKPLWVMVDKLLEEGIASGELVTVDPVQMRYASLGANVFYFLSAPLTQLVMGVDPLERGELAQRRKLAIEYLGQTIFADREHGVRVAARVLEATPMPATFDSAATDSCNAYLKTSNIEAAQTSAIETRQK